MANGQKTKSDAIRILKEFSDFRKTSVWDYIAILPLESCFDCDKLKASELKRIGKGSKVLLVYTSARIIVQEKMKKATAPKVAYGEYIFDDKVYQKFYVASHPKGYFISMR